MPLPLQNKKEKNLVIIANWKMNLGVQESELLATALKDNLKNIDQGVQVIVCPSFVALDRIHQILFDSSIKLGAQDAFWEVKGPYTGMISVDMLVELGCQYIIVGHFERKKYAFETDEIIDRKMATIVKKNLTPILCVGETMEQRRDKVQELVVSDQIKKAVRHIRPPAEGQKIIIAYEPVWSIYPGQPCQPKEAKEMGRVVKQALVDLYPLKLVENNFIIIYGGSVDENNVQDYVDGEDLQGVLVGNASLEAQKFINIIKKMV